RAEKSSNENKARETAPPSYTSIDPCTMVEFVMVPVLTRALSPEAVITSISGGKRGCMAVSVGLECLDRWENRAFSQRSGRGQRTGKVTAAWPLLCCRLRACSHRRQWCCRSLSPHWSGNDR